MTFTEQEINDAIKAALTDKDKQIAALKDSAKADDVQFEMYKARIADKDKRISELEAAIKIQSNAVKTLRSLEDSEINILRKTHSQSQLAIKTLDSEKDMNSTLTQEIEALESELNEIKTQQCIDKGNTK